MTEKRQEINDSVDDLDQEIGEMLDDAFGYDNSEQEATSDAPKIDKPSIWTTIRRFFFKTASEQSEERRTRMYILNQAIETYPDAPANYLLRGELHLQLGQAVYAEEDFEKALELASAQYETDRWGLGAQAIQDRARQGLQRIVH